MRRDTENFSMYSDMSMRTMALLAVEQGTRPAPSPARSCPRRWGPGTGTSRWDGSGSDDARRGSGGWPRLTEAHGLVLAHHALVQHVLQVEQLVPSRPPSASATGMPVQRSMMTAAISSSGDLVLQQGTAPCPAAWRSALPRPLQLLLQLGDAARSWSSAARFRSYSPLGALQLERCALSRSLSELLHVARWRSSRSPTRPCLALNSSRSRRPALSAQLVQALLATGLSSSFLSGGLLDLHAG